MGATLFTFSVVLFYHVLFRPPSASTLHVPVSKTSRAGRWFVRRPDGIVSHGADIFTSLVDSRYVQKHYVYKMEESI
jgi:hypothetical protein